MYPTALLVRLVLASRTADDVEETVTFRSRVTKTACFEHTSAARQNSASFLQPTGVFCTSPSSE